MVSRKYHQRFTKFIFFRDHSNWQFLISHFLIFFSFIAARPRVLVSDTKYCVRNHRMNSILEYFMMLQKDELTGNITQRLEIAIKHILRLNFLILYSFVIYELLQLYKIQCMCIKYIYVWKKMFWIIMNVIEKICLKNKNTFNKNIT